MTDGGEGPLTPAREPRELTVVHGEIDASDTTAHLLFPTRDEQPFLPFQRFAESMATSRRKGEMHPHIGEEVIQYVLEGYIDHEDGSGNHTSLTEGSLLVLTARDEVQHALRMERGRTARWLSIVVRLPVSTEAPSTSLQILTASRPPVGSDGTVRTSLVGSNGPARTSSGLELIDIGFSKEATAFLRVGRDRRGIAYVLSGFGSVENHGLEPGHGVLLENMSGLSLHGDAGYRVALASVPRPVA